MPIIQQLIFCKDQPVTEATTTHSGSETAITPPAQSINSRGSSGQSSSSISDNARNALRSTGAQYDASSSFNIDKNR